MMTSIIEKLPFELKLKILSYKQSPPHFFAMKHGLFPIRDSLLPPIKEDDEWIYLLESENEEEDELMFLIDDITPSHHYFVSLPQPFHYSYYSDSFL